MTLNQLAEEGGLAVRANHFAIFAAATE